ncbi:MAG: thioredoxin-like domain-containing protein [Cyanobacteria bacterium P01_A01_bin.105]
MRVRPPQISAELPWLNVQTPLSLQKLKGHIVLLKFWTLGCINCLHMMPVMQQLEQHYGPALTIIGIHSAKFEAEQSPDRVQQAITQHGISHPVVVDKGLQLWQAYAVKAWPTLVFIDAKGYIVRQISGERSIEQLQHILAPLAAPLATPLTADTGLQATPPAAPAFRAPVLRFPSKLLATETQLFIADSGHHRIVVTDPTGQVQHVIGAGTAGLQDGDFATATFNHPQGLAWDAQQQQLYIADAGNHALRQADFIQQRVTTLAGNGTQNRAIFPHGGMGTALLLNSPWDLVLLAAQQQLYIAMAGAHQIWVMDLATGRLETYLGTGAEGCMDGDRTVAAFAQPSGLATDGQMLYVADSETSCIRQVHLGSDPWVETLCGSGGLFDFGDRDGVGEAVRLQHPMDVAIGGAATLLIADTYNGKLKQLSLTTKQCQGLPQPLNQPSGIAYQAPQIYVTDASDHPIKVINCDRSSHSILALDPAPLRSLQLSGE